MSFFFYENTLACFGVGYTYMVWDNAEAKERTNDTPKEGKRKNFDWNELDACTPERVVLWLATR